MGPKRVGQFPGHLRLSGWDTPALFPGSNTHTHTLSSSHTYTYARTHTHTVLMVHTHTHTQAYTISWFKHMHRHTHIYNVLIACAHTHTHTRTHCPHRPEPLPEKAGVGLEGGNPCLQVSKQTSTTCHLTSPQYATPSWWGSKRELQMLISRPLKQKHLFEFPPLII